MPSGMPSPGLAYPGSRMSPDSADLRTFGSDPNDDYWREGPAINNRSLHMWRTNDVCRAMVECITSGTLGSMGVKPRSAWQPKNRVPMKVDANGEPTPAQRKVHVKRGQIDDIIDAAYDGTRFDAAGQLSRRDMDEVELISMIACGDAIAVRCWRPQRPGRQVQATCWRIIDPARVSNPNFAYNTPRMYDGFELDDSGSPIAIHVQRRHPDTLVAPEFVWDRIPIFAPDGSRNVTHMKAPGRPDQIRGIGWFAPIMEIVNQLGGTRKAYAVTKRLQACIGLIFTNSNPAAFAKSMKGVFTMDQISQMFPGMMLQVPTGSTVTPLQWQFNGDDFEKYNEAIITGIAAAWSLPMEFVMNRLTKSNLASARAALAQAFATFVRWQNHLIIHSAKPKAESVLIEADARGQIDLGDDLDAALRFRWNRPSRSFPDPLKEAGAAKSWHDLGRSLSGIFGDQGQDFEDEIEQTAQDLAFAKAHGVPIFTGATPATGAAGAADAGGGADGNDGPGDEGKPGENDDAGEATTDDDKNNDE